MYFGKVKPKIDSNRVPPNQNITSAFPVLHHGNVPYYKKDLSDWDLKIFGEVETFVTYTFEQMMNLTSYRTQNDIHCVTGWSKLDNNWDGIQTRTLVKEARPLPEAKYVIIHTEENWSTNIPLDDFTRETSLFAHIHNGEILTPEHGYPLRLVIPHLYFWKSAKWVRGIEFSVTDKPGFWEKNGYHNYGNPFREERFSWD